jgi:MFS family permease
MFSLTGLFYVVTGIQYWLPDYIQNVLDIEPHTATLYFVIVSLSAPIGGVIVGGIITASYGGYNTKKAQKLQCLMGVCAVICCLPVPFFYEKKSFYYVGMLFWGILFFGGFILPPVTGIMINSVPDDQKASANSIANLTYNLFGYLPGPVIYGFVATFTATPGPPGTVNKSRWAMAVLLYSTIPTITCLLWGINKKIKMKDSDEDRRASTLLPKKNENQKE